MYDRVILAALEEQWREWWNDTPSGGRFELCEVPRSAWAAVKQAVRKLREERGGGKRNEDEGKGDELFKGDGYLGCK